MSAWGDIQPDGPGDEPWARTSDRNVWRACKGGLVLTVTRIADGSGSAATGCCPPRRYPAPRRSTHPTVTHRGLAALRELVEPSSSRQMRRSPCERCSSPGRNAAHFPGWPLQRSRAPGDRA